MTVLELATTLSKMRTIEMDAMVDVLPDEALYALLATFQHEHEKRLQQRRSDGDLQPPHPNERISPGRRSDDPDRSAETREDPR